MKQLQLSPQHIKFLKSERRRAVGVHLARCAILVGFLLVWELLAQLKVIDVFLTSCPSRVFTTLASMTAEGQLTQHVWASLYETVVGYIIGTALGYVIAIALWWNDTARKIFEPYLVVINSLPKIALGPLIILWAGTGKKSIVVMTVLISVVITAISLMNGFCETDKNKILLMKSMHASKWQTFTKLVAPANLPTLTATLKINVGMSWVGSIMGEYLVSKEGLGYLLVYGSQTFRLDLVMSCTILLCALAGLMYAAVVALEKLLLRNKY